MQACTLKARVFFAHIKAKVLQAILKREEMCQNDINEDSAMTFTVRWSRH